MLDIYIAKRASILHSKSRCIFTINGDEYNPCHTPHPYGEISTPIFCVRHYTAVGSYKVFGFNSYELAEWFIRLQKHRGVGAVKAFNYICGVYNDLYSEMDTVLETELILAIQKLDDGLSKMTNKK